ncbi:Protein of unknown function [Actinacidiphila yanglinensis]|uniref:DUF4232 domain-containing protein n=1 Tax=Actinacidiphila yanglinensis TaxID=310779 RepID=A0A1H6EBS0_9ACTN|nr:DUF4232 domain-containing protein [Actinacidiphila yanglinensis]SEG95217.1 Protein of unknown function [Actinacidiphila yanglinensis]
MRTRPAARSARLLLATAVVAALAATATACGSGNDDAAGSAPASSTAPASPLAPSSSAAAPSSAPSAGAPSAAAPSAGSSSTGGSGNDVASSGGKTPSCRTADLTMQAKNTSPDSRTGDVTVLMTNRGSGTCSAAGFAGADLKDSDGTSVSVARGREVPKITDLRPGQTASFSISYSVDTSGDHLYNPVAILTTPPNETHSVSLKWPAGAPPLAGPYGSSTIQVHPVAIEG